MEITAKLVLENVRKCLEELDKSETGVGYSDRTKYSRWSNKRKLYTKVFRTYEVCEELSIFDWWGDTLSRSQLKEMESFLKEAIKLGYDGYVCFKVGATGCANGMWAHKELSKTGYSPDGECIYKSFTPDYNYWSVSDGNDWYPNGDDGVKFDHLKTVRAFEQYLKDFK